jgi:hypothetical protein
VDSITFFTASSNRSNSTSLIALFEGAEIPNVRIAIFPKIIDAISGPDCVLLIAVKGQEAGAFSTKSSPWLAAMPRPGFAVKHTQRIPHKGVKK